MVQAGNVIHFGDAYQDELQGVDLYDGRRFYRVTGAGVLTSTPQTIIPIQVQPAWSKEARDLFPVGKIVLPAGAEILSASIRLPFAKPTDGMLGWGRHLPTGCTINGTATDVLKVSFEGGSTITTFAAAKTANLVCQTGGRWNLGAGNRISRRQATADDSSGILNTLSSAQTVNVVVANTGNTAAGAGISLSVAGVTALVAVDVYYTLVDDAVLYRDIQGIDKQSLWQ